MNYIEIMAKVHLQINEDLMSKTTTNSERYNEVTRTHFSGR